MTHPTEQELHQPATTPVTGNAAALAAPRSEGERRALETLREAFEPGTAGDDDPWREVLGPLLDRREVQRLLGVASAEALDQLVRDNQVLALPTPDGDAVYPAFQFSPAGKPYPTLAKIIDILGRVVATPYTIATWLTSPRVHLGGETPIRWLELGHDPARVIAEARVTAGHLAQ